MYKYSSEFMMYNGIFITGCESGLMYHFNNILILIVHYLHMQEGPDAVC